MNVTQHAMREGLPVRYWRVRNLISVAQVLVVLAVLTGAALWAVTDDNGPTLWQHYYSFAQGVSDFANNEMRLPWE